MKFKILFCLIFVHTTEGCSFYYTGMTDFKNLGLLGETFEYPNYWRLPKVTLKNAEEEAIMLIGGTCLVFVKSEVKKGTHSKIVHQ